ncbi:MAG: DNA polymerase III subunit gamma/tau [Actinomycetota bacterium]
MPRYQALYRKYRPQRFDEVIGQDHVVGTLAHEVTDAKVAHAYLFAGPRGTGKTTSARLLAKALNCTNRAPDGEPCNECVSCLSIAEGTSLDVIELDAASHNKVEDVREIRVNVGTVAAAEGAHRVYILDEAHMLSRAAGNALLKTLEEPPEHVVFVLATTEPYKLLDTIRSRSQRFDFHPVSSETLIDFLTDIAGREGFSTDHTALSMIATHSRGSVRDSLSLLEQVAALGNGTVASEGVTRALGLAEDEAFAQLAEAIAAQDAPTALGLVARLASQGSDLRRFVADALGYFRGIFLAQYAPNLEEITDEPPEVLDEWRRQARVVSSPDVLRAIDRFSEALLHLRQGREERLVLELTLIRLTRPETALDAESLSSRIERLERESRATSHEPRVASHEPRVMSPEPATEEAALSPVPPDEGRGDAEERSDDAGGTVPDAGDAPEIPEPATAVDETPEPVKPTTDAEPTTDNRQPTTPEVPDADGEAGRDLTLSEFSTAWPVMVARVRSDFGARRHAFVKVAEPLSVEGSVAVLTLPIHQHFHLEQLNADDQLLAALERIATETLGTSVTLVFRSDEDTTPVSEEPERVPDAGDLDDGPAQQESPTDVIADLLGGKIVES